MKFQTIYDLVGSYYFESRKDNSNGFHPLWLILESKRLNLRIWVTSEWNSLGITTAQLDLPCDSKEYHESYRRYDCSGIYNMEGTLSKILLKPYHAEDNSLFSGVHVRNLAELKRQLTVGSRYRVLQHRQQKYEDNVRIVSITHKNGANK